MRRILAFIVDLLILLPAAGIALYLIQQVSNRQLLEESTGLYLFLLPLSFACVEAVRGGVSPGKYLFALTLIDVATGKAPSPLKLFLRASILFDSAYLATQLIPGALEILGLRSPFQASIVIVLLIATSIPFVATRGRQVLHDSLIETAVSRIDNFQKTGSVFSRTRMIGLLLVGCAFAFFFSLPGAGHFARGTDEDTQLDPLLRILEAQKADIAALPTSLLSDDLTSFDAFAVDHRAVKTKEADLVQIEGELRKAYPSAIFAVDGSVSEYAIDVTLYGFLSSRFNGKQRITALNSWLHEMVPLLVSYTLYTTPDGLGLSISKWRPLGLVQLREMRAAQLFC